MSDGSPGHRSPAVSIAQNFVLILLGVGLIFGVEGLLRLFGVGGANKLFLTESAPNGVDFFVTNDKLNERLFFPVTGEESDFPRPQVPYARFAVEKETSTFRVFVVGASSSVGFPFSPNVSFAGFLREMLADAMPGGNVELINTSMTAISSYQVGRWVREIISRYDPDAVIVYTGHNEVYGVLGAGSSMSVGTNRLVTRLFLNLQNTAIYSLVARGLERFSEPEPGGKKGQPLESLTKNREVRPDSELYRSVQRNFKANLTQMARAAIKRDVPIFFCTPISNRAGCAPMVPIYRADISDDDKRAFDRALQYGDTRRRAGEFRRAEEEYAKALEIDEGHGGVYYRSGLLHLDQGQVEQARESFADALLRDGLQLRASDKLAAIVREVSDELGDRGVVHLVDCVEKLDHESEVGVVGTDLVFEHVHPNGKGHYLIALEIFREMAGSKLGGAFQSDTPPLTFDQAAALTGYTNMDKAYAYRFMSIMLRQWPFENTFRNQVAISRTNEELRIALEGLNDLERDVFDSHPVEATILHLRHRLGLAYLNADRPGEAAEQFLIISRMLPHLPEVRMLLARSLFESGRADNAYEMLKRAIEVGLIDRGQVSEDPNYNQLSGDGRFAEFISH